MKIFATLLLTFLSFACSQGNDSESINEVEIEEPELNLDIPIENLSEGSVTPGSQKELLLDDWQAVDDPELLAVISAAVHRYRSRK